LKSIRDIPLLSQAYRVAVLFNAALSDDPARSRPRPGPANRGAYTSGSQGAEAKARGATLTFAERAFAGAELRAQGQSAIGNWQSEMPLTLRTLRRK
jgi:predicted membrane metal-binding protein